MPLLEATNSAATSTMNDDRERDVEAGKNHRQCAEKHHAGEQDVGAGAVVPGDVPVDLVDGGGAGVGVDDDRKKYADRDDAIFEASPNPNASNSSGISATLGIGNRAAISGSKKMRTGRNIAMNSPIAIAGMPPMK